MPQWSRDRSSDAADYPDERWQAECPQADGPLLLRYDHHTVWLAGRQALILTYHWASVDRENHAEPLTLDVSFTYAPGHPRAPASVQQIVDRLTFRPQDDPQSRR